MADDIENEPIAHRLIREAIWKQIGESPESATDVIDVPDYELFTPDIYELIADDDELLESAAVDFDEVIGTDLKSMSTQMFTIINGTWEHSRTSGVSGYNAYLLADYRWYVERLTSTDEYFLTAIVPGALFDNVARRLARHWLRHEGFLDYSGPTLIVSDFANDVWFARDVAMSASGRIGEFVEESNLPPLGSADRPYSLEVEIVREWWDMLVESKPAPTGEEIPGLADWTETSGAFQAWLETVSIRWRDNQEQLSSSEAEDLRLGCLYLSIATVTT